MDEWPKPNNERIKFLTEKEMVESLEEGCKFMKKILNKDYESFTTAEIEILSNLAIEGINLIK